MMDCLATIKNSMKTYNLLSLPMPESYWEREMGGAG